MTTTPKKPYVLEFSALLECRVLVYADDLPSAHENMHELADGFIAEMLKRAAETPYEEMDFLQETMDVRPALAEEAVNLDVGTLTMMDAPNFFTEAERQVQGHFHSEHEGDEHDH